MGGLSNDKEGIEEIRNQGLSLTWSLKSLLRATARRLCMHARTHQDARKLRPAQSGVWECAWYGKHSGIGMAPHGDSRQ